MSANETTSSEKLVIFEELPGQMARELASALSFTRPSVVLLEELQTGLDLAAIEADVICEDDSRRTIASITEEERTVLTDMWSRESVSRTKAEGWESVASVLRVNTPGREAIVSRHELLDIGCEILLRPDRPLDLGDARLTQLRMWCTESALANLSQQSNALATMGGSLCRAAETAQDVPRPEINETLRTFRAAFLEQVDPGEVELVISSAIEAFDLWLRRFLQHRSVGLQREELANPFLAQYFWVLGGSPEVHERVLTPAFLPKQLELVERVSRRLEEEQFLSLDSRRLDWREALKFAKTYRLSQRFSFTGYVASTGLSVYVADWPNAPLISRPTQLTEAEREERRFFSLLMRESQLEHLRVGPSDAPALRELNGRIPVLYTVPAMIGDEAVFIVQLNFPRRVDRKTLNIIARRVRELSGVLVLAADFQTSLRRREAEMDRELLFERSKARVVQEALVREMAHTLKGSLPAIKRILRDALDRSKSTAPCELPRQDVLDLLSDLDATSDKIERIRAEIQMGYVTEKAEDLREVIGRSIASIPIGRKKALKVVHGGDWTAPAFVKTRGIGLETAIQNIIINAAEAAGGHGELQISLKRRVPDPFLAIRMGTEVAFHDDGPGLEDPADVEKLWSFTAGKKQHGRGWGLPLVRYFVSDLGGRVSFDLSVSRGTRLVIWLPLIAQEPAQRENKDQSGATGTTHDQVKGGDGHV